jgi:hypothetical protein
LDFSGGGFSAGHEQTASSSGSAAPGGDKSAGDFSRSFDLRQGVMAGINEINEEVSK